MESSFNGTCNPCLRNVPLSLAFQHPLTLLPIPRGIEHLGWNSGCSLMQAPPESEEELDFLSESEELMWAEGFLLGHLD